MKKVELSKGKVIALIVVISIIVCGLLGAIAYQVLNNMHAFTNYHESDKSIDGYFENVDNPILCGKYKGDFKNGKRNGQGTMTYVSGVIKSGTWLNDSFVGV